MIGSEEPTGSSVELKFGVSDRELFFVHLSAEADCRVTLAEMIHRSDGQLLEFFTVEAATPDQVLGAATEAAGIGEARVVRNEGTEDESLYEFVVDGPCIGGTLASEGAVVREVVAVDGVGRVVADLPPHADSRGVVEAVRERHDAELIATRERDRATPDFTCREFRATLADRLTERQLETIRVAYAGGYFSWPRESTAEECATALGISQPTFTQHLRVGEEKLLKALFDEVRRSDTGEGAPVADLVTQYR